jgi:integrase
VNWLNPIIGELPLTEIKNEVAKQLVAKMRATLSDKTTVNYFQVVRAVVASAVSDEGEQIHPRNWNFQFIGLPIVDERNQQKPTLTVAQVEQIIALAKGRYKALFALLAATGLRIGEALGLRIEHISEDFQTISVSQSVWRGKTQSPKTANAFRQIDVHPLDKYAEQLKEDDEWRKAEAERIGLGFSLSAKALIGQLGQPDAKISRRKKAA